MTQRRTRDQLVALIGENAADNYLSFPDEEETVTHDRKECERLIAEVLSDLRIASDYDRQDERRALGRIRNNAKPLSDALQGALAEIDRLSRETEKLADEDTEFYRLQREAIAMRPVVAWAEAWRDEQASAGAGIAAVDEYRRRTR